MEVIKEIVRIKQIVEERDIRQLQININSPLTAKEIATHFIGDDDREVFLVMCLNTKNQVNAVHRASIGAISSAIVHPREVFKVAFYNNANTILLAHNHPSGDVTPSSEDVEVTKLLVESGKILGIEVLDHIIVSPNRYYSFKEQGRM